jgi:signal transduction histidine kinase
MLRKVFARIAPHLGLDAYFNFMVNEAGDALQLESCQGIPKEEVQKLTRLEFGQAICGNVALRCQPIVATHIQQSDEPMVQLVKSYGLRAYACNPLLSGDKLLGTLSFASRSRDEFDARELEFLQTICHYVTVAYERVRLIQQLREADRRKDEFLAMLAHELRNPLAPIRNSLQILRVKGPADDDLAECRDMIDRQVTHLVRLVDDLLDVSRVSRGKIRLHQEPLDLAAVVRQAVETTRPLIDSRRHQLTVTVPSTPVYVEGDFTRLSQVIGNLLNNAAKYTDEGGRIELTMEAADHEAVLRVRDSGRGMDPSVLHNLFDLFYQSERNLDRSEGGLGIGLSLVKTLVEMHGGKIEAHSDGRGRGSEFVVRLPRLSEPPALPATSSRSARVAAGPHRILIVDDNVDSAESMAILLRLQGHSVQTAHDGNRAVELALRDRPSLVLLDLGLPGLNGYEACRAMRAGGLTDALIVAMTGYGQDEDRRQSNEAGFDDHLVKPVDPAALEELLARLPVSHG